jgi:hypothetical protein
MEQRGLGSRTTLCPVAGEATQKCHCFFSLDLKSGNAHAAEGGLKEIGGHADEDLRRNNAYYAWPIPQNLQYRMRFQFSSEG